MSKEDITENEAAIAEKVASKGAKGKKATGGKVKKGGGKLAAMLWLLASLPIGFILWPSVLLSIPLMAPTFVAFLFELRQKKYMTRSIGFLNAVAILPTLGILWESGHVASRSINLLFDVKSWAFVFAGAGAGYVIFIAAEWIVAAYYRATARDRLKKIGIQQQALTELWGDEVITPQAAQIISEIEVVMTEDALDPEDQQAA